MEKRTQISVPIKDRNKICVQKLLEGEFQLTVMKISQWLKNSKKKRMCHRTSSFLLLLPYLNRGWTTTVRDNPLVTRRLEQKESKALCIFETVIKYILQQEKQYTGSYSNILSLMTAVLVTVITTLMAIITQYKTLQLLLSGNIKIHHI